MALIFPNNPAVNQTYQSGSSATYKWNGSYWTVSAPQQTGLTVYTASYSERVANIQSNPPTTGTGSFWYDIDTGNSYIKYDTNWVPVQSNTVNATSASFSTTASLARTASVLASNTTPYYIQAGNSSGQSIATNTVTTVTGWTTAFQSTGSAWNASTGVFTCPRAGWYRLRGSVSYVANTAAIGQEFNVIVSVNNGSVATAWTFRTTTNNVVTAPPPVESIHFLNIGDTVAVRTYQDSGSDKSLSARADINLITIQELPNLISK